MPAGPGVFSEFIDLMAAKIHVMLMGLPSLPGLGIELLVSK